ncbi:hypothetical protein EVA_09477 [gut metagenome]|uniref:Uncharacterized protein n=1 Tax=gut metagenome TaxID=749906 RepID=J9G6B9_9ZZZZ
MYDRFTIQFNRSVISINKPDNHIKSGCFTCSVGTQKSYNFTGFHFKTDAFNDSPRAVVFHQLISFKGMNAVLVVINIRHDLFLGLSRQLG